jgi:polysaccharide export outer membrane protein
MAVQMHLTPVEKLGAEKMRSRNTCQIRLRLAVLAAILIVGIALGGRAAGSEAAGKAESVRDPVVSNTPLGYRIGAGDVLQVLVWKEPEASVASVVVRADGMISVPLVKEVPVIGLTLPEAEKMLAERFAHYIHGPDVTIIAKEIHSKRIYLVGAIKKEGVIPLQSSMTVLQAITEAGGLTEYAKPKKIYVLRNEGGKQLCLPFDYQAVIKGQHIEQNIAVRPDDTIVVPH